MEVVLLVAGVSALIVTITVLVVVVIVVVVVVVVVAVAGRLIVMAVKVITAGELNNQCYTHRRKSKRHQNILIIIPIIIEIPVKIDKQ